MKKEKRKFRKYVKTKTRKFIILPSKDSDCLNFGLCPLSDLSIYYMTITIMHTFY